MQIVERKITFMPSLLPTLAAVVAIALTLYLAIWQQGRAAEKRALQAEFTERTLAPPLVISATFNSAGIGDAYRYRLASARGQWQAANQIFIDNKFNENGAVGYHVITPLKVDNSDIIVLVNRGWIVRSAAYPLPPLATPPIGDVEVRGVLTAPSKRFLELTAHATEGNVWQNLTIDRYRIAMKINVLPFVLLASETVPPNTGLVPQAERPDAGVEKHVEYMLTWYSLAVTVALLWIGLNLHIQRAGLITNAAANTGNNAKNNVTNPQQKT